MSTPVFGVAGFKNSGKTTLVERMIGEISARGYSVSTIKHAHHNFDIDHPGRDSHRHRQAGAKEVAVLSRHRWALIHELRGGQEPSMEEMLAKLSPGDLVIVEGYKFGPQPKIEIRDLSLSHRELAGDDDTIVAIAATGPVDDTELPVFGRDDVSAICDFILGHCGVKK
jgi:molybdopterin-guanine dinucleotide biosynthesis protein B